MNRNAITDQFFASLGRPWLGESLFDAVEDCVFFIKDREARYVAVNQTLVTRCGLESKDQLIGRTAREVYPEPLGDSFTDQDLEVIREGRAFHGQLELHLYANGGQGWCLTWKEPVTNGQGNVVGLSGISRDIGNLTDTQGGLGSISAVLTYIREHPDEPLRLNELADQAGLSVYQFDQRIRTLYGISAGQYITKVRIDYACHLLERSDESISFIALDCGYGDQSAFTRQFKRSVGLTPKAYRERATKS